MKTAAIVVAWSALAIAVVYVLLGPTTGVLQASPVNTLGLGLIGLGICLDAHKRAQKRQHEHA